MASCPDSGPTAWASRRGSLIAGSSIVHASPNNEYSANATANRNRATTAYWTRESAHLQANDLSHNEVITLKSSRDSSRSIPSVQSPLGETATSVGFTRQHAASLVHCALMHVGQVADTSRIRNRLHSLPILAVGDVSIPGTRVG